MEKVLSVKLLPTEAFDVNKIKTKIATSIGVKDSAISGYYINKRSIDARSKQVYYVVSLTAFINEPFIDREKQSFSFKDVSNSSKSVIIIGAGPAGLFAALQFIENGIKPIILERGKNVRDLHRPV